MINVDHKFIHIKTNLNILYNNYDKYNFKYNL